MFSLGINLSHGLVKSPYKLHLVGYSLYLPWSRYVRISLTVISPSLNYSTHSIKTYSDNAVMYEGGRYASAGTTSLPPTEHDCRRPTDPAVYRGQIA